MTLDGRPDQLRLGNGPELTWQTLTDWCAQRGIGLQYIQPGKPVQKHGYDGFFDELTLVAGGCDNGDDAAG